MSISSILNITKQALADQRSAVNTVAKNISNINTDGYKRRRIDLNSHQAMFNSKVTADNITRIRQRFVENQLFYENQNLGKYQTDEMIMTQIENIFGEPLESGLSNIMSEFWNSWGDLANDPESQYARTIVRDKGVSLSKTFNRIYSDLDNINQQINKDIQDKVNQVNQIVDQINSINKQVSANNSDDLMDQRDLLISNLSNLINIDIREGLNGKVTISTDGQILVSNGYVNNLSVNISREGSITTANIQLVDGKSLVDINSGELGSLIEINNRYIPDYISKLNTLASSIAEQVNAIHSKGYSVDGTTGINFFADDVTGANNLRVSDEVFSDPSVISTSSLINEPGDGSIAQSVFDLQFYQGVEGNTVFDFYNTIIGQIGSQVQESGFLKKSQEMVVQNLKNQRDSVSGVSLDEEMVNLIEHEQAYQAAARMVSTVDEMMQTVLNML